jgi:malonyl CoA-acyl carrier protein transacylase
MRQASAEIMGVFQSSDESFARLKRAGWSVGEVRVLSLRGAYWLVTGANGENMIEARGATQAEAWHRACEQAEALGMLARRKGSISFVR